jgi:hypothetical protein
VTGGVGQPEGLLFGIAFLLLVWALTGMVKEVRRK